MLKVSSCVNWAVNISPYLPEKERARKMVIVMFDTSGTGRSRVRQRSYMAADSSESNVS